MRITPDLQNSPRRISKTVQEKNATANKDLTPSDSEDSETQVRQQEQEEELETSVS